MKKMDNELKIILNKIINDGYTAIMAEDTLKKDSSFFNWMFYLIEGEGSGYIEKDDFGRINISSEYISKREGRGARFRDNIDPVSLSNRTLKNAVTHSFSGEVNFIKDLKTLLVHEDYWFPYIHIFKKEGNFRPFDALEELDQVYIVKHGPNYRPQLYLKNPKLGEEAVAIKIEDGDFIEIKGKPLEQIKLLKEAFPYVEEKELCNRLTCF